jgi:hypothetical protein
MRPATTRRSPLRTYGRRFDPPEFPAVWHGGQSLYLCGTADDWNDVVSLEVRYAPVAPAFTTLAGLFFLPDAAKPAVVAALADSMAQRVAGMEGVSIDTKRFERNALSALDDFLSSIRLSRRARTAVIRDGGN